MTKLPFPPESLTPVGLPEILFWAFCNFPERKVKKFLQKLKRKRNDSAAQGTPPRNNQCTHKYAARIQIPYLSKHSLGFPRESILKKGCDSDGDTWEDCFGECDEICYKDPVLKDRQWIQIQIKRKILSITDILSPVAASYSEFDLPSEKVKSSSFKETIKHPTVEKPPAPSDQPLNPDHLVNLVLLIVT